jgi:ACT domain-containing protein
MDTRLVSLEVELKDSPSEQLQVIYQELNKRGDVLNWIVSDADAYRKSIRVDAVVKK